MREGDFSRAGFGRGTLITAGRRPIKAAPPRKIVPGHVGAHPGKIEKKEGARQRTVREGAGRKVKGSGKKRNATVLRGRFAAESIYFEFYR